MFKVRWQQDKVLGDRLFLVRSSSGLPSGSVHKGARDEASLPVSHPESAILVTSAEPVTTCKGHHLRA